MDESLVTPPDCDGSGARERLLSLLLEADRRQRAATQNIVGATGANDAIPLSYAQERLWLLDQIGLAGSAYNLPLALRLRGELVEEAVERSVSEVIRRHAVLRTHFAVLDGTACQVIEAYERRTLDRLDLSKLSDADERERQLHEVIRREQLHRFDLSSGPLLRGVLVKLAPNEHALLLTVHHIIFDGWSLGLLLDELSRLYEAYAGRHPSHLPELPIQYSDFAVWQRQWLRGDVFRQHLEYWKEQLQGAPPGIQLPGDRPRSVVDSLRGAELQFELPAGLATALNQLARSEGATLFMVCLAAFQLLLARWSGQNDIVVGSPIAGRTRPETESLLGFFINTLALRTDISGDPTFRELLARVRQMTLGAYAHQDMPFEILVKELRPERHNTQQPIFQVMLALQNFPQQHLKLPELTCTWIDAPCVTAHFDLTLHLYEGSGTLAGVFLYSTDLFDAATIRRLADGFTVLLQGIVADPEGRISRLPLLDAAQRRRLLVEWNATAAAFPHDKHLHELFAEQARRTPDSVAVSDQHQSLTYDELNRRANQLAWYLRGHGVGPERLVALYLGRSVEMLVGLFGILKAGGAYVPLDPTNPLDRLEHVLADARPQVVLTTQALRSSLRGTAASVVAIDADWPLIETQSEQDPDASTIGLTPRNLAYVIYTSGSTGKPKGVMIEHCNVVNYAVHALRQFDVAAGNGSLISTSISFDLVLTGLYPTLFCGRTVRLCAEHDGLAEIADELLQSTNLAPLKLTPSHLPLLDDALKAGRLAGRVRALVLGGEPLRASAVQLWRKHAPQTRIFNHYGPTETTVGCIVHEVAEPTSGCVPIGRPITNASAYILDPLMQPVPIGVVGELYMGGAGVGRGYLNRPDLTAERFVRDPFGTDPDARLYRTGDLCRWRADGVIEYLGRNDQQVKIRGYRIELGEIAAHLARHEAVKDAAVIAREDVIPGEKCLVAYLTLCMQTKPDIESLRAHLKGLLPLYMVPSAFVFLDRLPVTSNGKLDHRALPPPDATAYAGRDDAPAQGELEQALERIWRELLRLDRVGRHANFFELGGHSLLALQLTARVAEDLGVRLSPVAIFQYPSIRQMAEVVGSRSAAEAAFDEGTL